MRKRASAARPAEPVAVEDWSRHGFYRTMLRLFIHRQDGCKKTEDHGRWLPEKPEDHAPFFLQDESRRLTQKQYECARECYVQAPFHEYQERGVRRHPGIEEARATRWPYPLPGEDLGVVVRPGVVRLTPAQVALGRLFFARTKAGQAKARAEVGALATRGTIARRKALGAAVRATPQAKAVHSPMALLFEILPYRASRQFMWAFLRAELLAAIRRKRREDGVDWTVRDLLRDPTDFGGELDGLVSASRFLERAWPRSVYGPPDPLSRTELLAGLKRRRPADADTARHFGLSPTSLRSLLTRAFGTRPD